jgi:A/G-specific adenine glycosylase
MHTDTFNIHLHEFYSKSSRSMPWRDAENGSFDPYKIAVSEIMLQQTQVDRVIPKFNAFIARFPDIRSLAQANLQEVLQLWSGLGYNRRAKYLHDFACAVQDSSNFPKTIEALSSHKGIGQNTAAAILVYSHNEPHLFIETNIRSVYINYFFSDRDTVSDKEILDMLEITIDRANPREFYWALMDYGSFLKKQGKGSLATSKTYKKQSKFEGSTRQLRGKIIKIVAASNSISLTDLEQLAPDERLAAVLLQLKKEKLIVEHEQQISVV